MLGSKLLSLGAIFGATVAMASPAIGQGTVKVDVAVGKAIEANMPTDTASTFPASVGMLVCWTKVTGGAEGSKITHVWIHGSDSTSIDVNVGGASWRTYSRKNIGATATGDWKVEIKDASGTVLATKTFTISG